VDDDGVVVRVVVVEVLRPRLLLRQRRPVDLLAEVPVQREVVTEAGDQFAVVQPALVAGIAAIEQQLVLGFLGLEVEVHAHPVAVLEDDLPLVELRDIHPQALAGGGVGVDVLVVAVDVHGQEREAVQPFGGEVVDGADQALALAALPQRVPGVPVDHVRLPVLDELVFHPVALEHAVEVLIGEQVLRRIDARLHEERAGLREAQVVLAHVVEPSFAAEVAAGLVGRGDGEAAGFAVEMAGTGARSGVVGHGHVRPRAEGNPVGPGARFLRGQVGPPGTAGGGRAVRRVAVGGVVARDHQRLAAAGMVERHLEPVVGEGIRRGGFAGGRAVEAERHLVPLAQLALKGGSGGGERGRGQRDEKQ
jgi:hypothetical protein